MISKVILLQFHGKIGENVSMQQVVLRTSLGCLVVWDTENPKASGNSVSNRLMMVDFPTPMIHKSIILVVQIKNIKAQKKIIILCQIFGTTTSQSGVITLQNIEKESGR